MRCLAIFYSNIHGQKREQNRIKKAAESQKIKVGKFLPNRKNPWKHYAFKGSVGGSGGIRTHEPLRATWFRVRAVMTTSIRFRICSPSKMRETIVIQFFEKSGNTSFPSLSALCWPDFRQKNRNGDIIAYSNGIVKHFFAYSHSFFKGLYGKRMPAKSNGFCGQFCETNRLFGFLFFGFLVFHFFTSFTQLVHPLDNKEQNQRGQNEIQNQLN